MSPTTKSGVIAASIVLGVALIIGISLGLSGGGGGRSLQGDGMPSESELLDKITSHAFWTTKPSRAKVEELADFAIRQGSAVTVLVDSECRYITGSSTTHQGETYYLFDPKKRESLNNETVRLDMGDFSAKRPERQRVLAALLLKLDSAENKRKL